MSVQLIYDKIIFFHSLTRSIIWPPEICYNIFLCLLLSSYSDVRFSRAIFSRVFQIIPKYTVWQKILLELLKKYARSFLSRNLTNSRHRRSNISQQTKYSSQQIKTCLLLWVKETGNNFSPLKNFVQKVQVEAEQKNETRVEQ